MRSEEEAGADSRAAAAVPEEVNALEPRVQQATRRVTVSADPHRHTTEHEVDKSVWLCRESVVAVDVAWSERSKHYIVCNRPVTVREV